MKVNSKYLFPIIHGRLLSYFVLDLGLAAVGLDLVSFLSMYSKTSS